MPKQRFEYLNLLVIMFLLILFPFFFKVDVKADLLPGELDTTLDTGGSFKGTPDASVYSLLELSDGKMLVGGSFYTYSGRTSPHFARLNSDGSYDASFSTQSNTSAVYAIAVQSNGKIIIAGDFTSYNSTSRGRIARLNTDGSLDSTFTTASGGANSGIRSVVIQPDGKILIGGYFTSYNGVATGYIARLNTNGSLDTTFANGLAGASNYVNTIALKSDGKMIIGGWFTAYNGTTRNRIAGLNNDGSLDTTFLATDTGANNIVNKITILSDDKLLVGGAYSSFNGVSRGRIAKLNSDGTLDTTFLNTGTGANSSVLNIVIQSDNKIIISGSYTSYNGITKGRIVRLNTDGSLDESFATSVTGGNGAIYGLILKSSGKIVVGGEFSTFNGVSRPYITGVNSDGTIDMSYVSGTNSLINTVAIQADGKILIGGSFTTFNGITRGRIARLNSDGSLDTSFANGLAGANNTIQTIAIQNSDGKILIGGNFTTYNGISRGYIARLNTDGSLDTTFLNTGSGSNSVVQTIEIQADENILIGGNFSAYNGITRGRVARLNTDGSLDTAFLSYGSGASALVRDIAVQSSDGKIIITGDFTSFDYVSKGRVARLDTDGSLDNTFLETEEGANASVYSTFIQPSGEIVFAGSFTTYNSTARGGIVRVNTDGSLDTSFLDYGSGANSSSWILNSTLLDDGKILISGYFSTYNGVSRGNIARLYSNGDLDTSFLGTGVGSNGSINDLAIQRNSSIIAVGNFSAYNSVGENNIVRIYQDVIPDIIGPTLYGTNYSSESYSNFWSSSALIATVRAFDTSSGLAWVKFSYTSNNDCILNGSSVSNGSTISIPSGANTLYLCAEDNSSNTSSWTAFYNWESTPPSAPSKMSLSVTTWTGDHYIKASSVLVNAPSGSTDTGGSLLAYYVLMRCDNSSLTLNCTSVASGVTSGTTTLSGSNLPSNGSTKYYYWISADNAGNTSNLSESEYLRMDTSAPTTAVVIVNPVYSPSTWVYANTIKGTASDGIGIGLSIVQITIQRNADLKYWTGSDWSSTQTWVDVTSGTSNWEYSMNDENFESGVTYTVKARGIDLLSNTTISIFGSDSFQYSTVGSAPPSGLILIDPAVSPGQVLTPTIRISGVTVGDLIKLYTDDCLTGLVGSITATSNTVDITTSSLPEGSYTFKSNAINSIGNASSCSSESVSYRISLGNLIVVEPTPAVVPVLANDWNTNVADTAQSGVVSVGVQDATDPTAKIAVLDVDFVTAPVWTGVTGGVSETVSFFHSTQPISTITNGAATSYSLYVKKGEGDKVWICPGADSLSAVTLNCSGGFFLSEGQTVNGATATVEGLYWKISGLTGTGGMSVITGLRDILSRLELGVGSDHTISFGTNFGLISGSTDTMTLEFPDFDLSSLTIADIELTDNVGVTRTLAASAGVNTWGVTINTVAKTIIFSVPTSGTGGYLPTGKIVIMIGLNVTGGSHQIINPISSGSFKETITLNNTAPGEMGELEIPIIDSDTVDISGYVTAFIHFDIDTNTDNTDCAYNVCKVHGGVGAGVGDTYTVDFGELTSAIVNKSLTSAQHSDGLTGYINSIYFDLTTNAPGGAVVSVKSLNSGLKGPGTNIISSVTDGNDIAANSGTYGYTIPTSEITKKHGEVFPNSMCDTIIKFCGATSTPKTVFDTNNLPVDSARVRMDLAAAAAYTNNPGLYEDTLTFVATATF
jgi:uncharacterized delta-60 repeat protein